MTDEPQHDRGDTDGNAGDITRLLHRARAGGPAEMDALFEVVYHHLKALARQRLRGASTPTLDVTALVHEVYLRLADGGRLDFQDRQHFFAVAAKAMRQVVVDRARRRMAAKRGGEAVVIPLGEPSDVGSAAAIDHVLAIDEALGRLAAVSPRLVQVVELCHFGGLTTEEAAGVLGVTSRTVKREWQKARLLLATWLRASRDGPPPGAAPGSAAPP